MKIELYSNLRDEDIEQILDRKGDLLAVKDSVTAIIDDVKYRGDVAVCDFTEKFDRAKISESGIRVSESEVSEAFEAVDDDLIVHLELAAENIRLFHESQKDPDMHLTESEPGVFLGQKIMPIASVGAYVPGGRAAYPSTALMTVIPAKVAGVDRVVVCTPPQPDGSVNPLTLVAASIAGADEIYRIGGVQAIAAIAYGTES
ncbi:MAG: histidinol dehydrogenase, partial [Methanosarcinales archaeon]|nr:histidinol dehydrogenase [Methanosarcinales archaeon]